MNMILDTSRTKAELRQLTVSLQSVRKSGRVIYAFTQFYLPFYNRDLEFIFFDRYDLFGGLSAAIYEIDENIEAGINKEEPFRQLDFLFDYLDKRIGCDQYIRERFEDARSYYRFETDLLRGSARYTFDDLTRLTEIRSFDFRLMHRVLAKLSSEQSTNEIFSWFRWFEMLMEIEDDLLSAQEDMKRGTYNIFCLATHLSPQNATVFVEDYRNRVERNLLNCSKLLPEQQSDICNSVFSAYRQIVTQPDVALLCKM